MNYALHAKESGTMLPEEFIIFSKATSSVSGPNDPVIIPRNSVKTDWEVELVLNFSIIDKKLTSLELRSIFG